MRIKRLHTVVKIMAICLSVLQLGNGSHRGMDKPSKGCYPFLPCSTLKPASIILSMFLLLLIMDNLSYYAESQPRTSSDLRHASIPSQYQYTPLHGSRLIRLLTILPAAKHDDPLHCSLSTVDIDDNPSCEALSYTWGDPFGVENPYYGQCSSREVMIGRRRLPIMLTLHEVLLQLRSCGFIGKLWADAICINQSDVLERSAQVNMMADIYEIATKVKVWLGKDNYTSNDVAQLLPKLSSADDLLLSISKDGSSPKDIWTPEYLGLPSASDPIWDSKSHFFKREWFQRF